MTPYEAACRAIDEFNESDPRREAAGGKSWSREVLYSHRMVEWVKRLAPQASEELLLAARAQHIGRWKTPRSEYPEGRMGYLHWREGLKKFHADTLGGIMQRAGYAEPSIAKIRPILLRKNLAADPEGQTLEDAACLVFLQFEFADFAAKTADAKVVDILRKTWGKMSTRAHEEAHRLSLGDHATELVRKALG